MPLDFVNTGLSENYINQKLVSMACGHATLRGGQQGSQAYQASGTREKLMLSGCLMGINLRWAKEEQGWSSIANLCIQLLFSLSEVE